MLDFKVTSQIKAIQCCIMFMFFTSLSRNSIMLAYSPYMMKADKKILLKKEMKIWRKEGNFGLIQSYAAMIFSSLPTD